jgi:tripartite-type tricarboxylate transporter receptor subunit TctC
MNRWENCVMKNVKLPRRRFLHLAAGAVALPALSQGACAQAYPSRPVTIVVPFPAGGPADVVGRILAEHMRNSLGQPFVVENVAGASGNIGVGRVARAAGDGYTLVVGLWNTHVANAVLFSLQYDVVKDFEPVALLSSSPTVLVGKKGMPANNLKELIAWLTANPDKASLGTSGAGSPAHVGGLLFQSITGTRFQIVPYRGSALAMNDLIAGQIDMMIPSTTDALQQIRAGTIKAYAVTAKSRSAAAPDIPTVDEAGMPGFYTSAWTALFAPKSTPKDVIGKLNAAVMGALADPAVRRRFAELDQNISPREQQTPEELRAYQQAEIDKWWPIIKAAGIKGE